MAVGRFQVMATLQAARAYVLGLPIESAKSWGLNRAIFYAAAKKGFFKGKIIDRKITPSRFKKEIEKEFKKEIAETFEIMHLGDEMAYSVKLKGRVYFIIGNEIQKETDFEKQIESRFEGNFKKAWQEAVKICKSYDKGVLLSQKYFYETVYKPRRDELAKKWSQLTTK